MSKHTPGPWFVSDWDDDNGTNFVTIVAHELEVLGPGRSSVWTSGIIERYVASTEEGNNPIEDAAHIVRCVNSHDELVAACESVKDWLMDPFNEADMKSETLHPAFKKAFLAVTAALSKARAT